MKVLPCLNYLKNLKKFLFLIYAHKTTHITLKKGKKILAVENIVLILMKSVLYT